jgi:L-2,4-diaminobutyrate decarboxylase
MTKPAVKALVALILMPTLENVQHLLDLVLAEADRIKDAIVAGTYVTALD